MENLKPNLISRNIGTLLMKNGINFIRQGSAEFVTIEDGIDRVRNGLKKVGITIPINELDLWYYYARWEDWQIIVEVINEIIKPFKWEAEKFDCDDRSNLVSSLCSLLFRLNTCAGLYCEVYDATTGALKYLHWCNIITDVDENIYLWDLDNGGQIQKITSNNVIMGNLKYKLLSVRIY